MASFRLSPPSQSAAAAATTDRTRTITGITTSSPTTTKRRKPKWRIFSMLLPFWFTTSPTAVADDFPRRQHQQQQHREQKQRRRQEQEQEQEHIEEQIIQDNIRRRALSHRHEEFRLLQGISCDQVMGILEASFLPGGKCSCDASSAMGVSSFYDIRCHNFCELTSSTNTLTYDLYYKFEIQGSAGRIVEAIESYKVDEGSKIQIAQAFDFADGSFQKCRIDVDGRVCDSCSQESPVGATCYESMYYVDCTNVGSAAPFDMCSGENLSLDPADIMAPLNSDLYDTDSCFYSDNESGVSPIYYYSPAYSPAYTSYTSEDDGLPVTPVSTPLPTSLLPAVPTFQSRQSETEETSIPSNQIVALEDPTLLPSMVPSLQPSEVPSEVPSQSPSLEPSNQPSQEPSVEPSLVPSQVPSETPSISAAPSKSASPSSSPSLSSAPTSSSPPSSQPSGEPSEGPSNLPSLAPSEVPSGTPSISPSQIPSLDPSVVPSQTPSIGEETASPSREPSGEPSGIPSLSSEPSAFPSLGPTGLQPTTEEPSAIPSISEEPSAIPSLSEEPSFFPSVSPTGLQPTTDDPSVLPSATPSLQPSLSTDIPSLTPSNSPSSPTTKGPSQNPSESPSRSPTLSPTPAPTDQPTLSNEPSISFAPTSGTDPPTGLPPISGNQVQLYSATVYLYASGLNVNEFASQTGAYVFRSLFPEVPSLSEITVNVENIRDETPYVSAGASSRIAIDISTLARVDGVIDSKVLWKLNDAFTRALTNIAAYETYLLGNRNVASKLMVLSVHVENPKYIPGKGKGKGVTSKGGKKISSSAGKGGGKGKKVKKKVSDSDDDGTHWHIRRKKITGVAPSHETYYGPTEYRMRPPTKMTVPGSSWTSTNSGGSTWTMTGPGHWTTNYNSAPVHHRPVMAFPANWRAMSPVQYYTQMRYRAGNGWPQMGAVVKKKTRTQKMYDWRRPVKKRTRGKKHVPAFGRGSSRGFLEDDYDDDYRRRKTQSLPRGSATAENVVR